MKSKEEKVNLKNVGLLKFSVQSLMLSFHCPLDQEIFIFNPLKCTYSDKLYQRRFNAVSY